MRKINLILYIVIVSILTSLLIVLNLLTFKIIEYWSLLTTFVLVLFLMVFQLIIQFKYVNQKITILNSLLLGWIVNTTNFVVLYSFLHVYIDGAKIMDVVSINWILLIMFEVIRYSIISTSFYAFFLTPIFITLLKNWKSIEKRNSNNF